VTNATSIDEKEMQATKNAALSDALKWRLVLATQSAKNITARARL
jgi:hypothetical protein